MANNDNNNTKICFYMHVNETALGRSAYRPTHEATPHNLHITCITYMKTKKLIKVTLDLRNDFHK